MPCDKVQGRCSDPGLPRDRRTTRAQSHAAIPAPRVLQPAGKHCHPRVAVLGALPPQPTRLRPAEVPTDDRDRSGEATSLLRRPGWHRANTGNPDGIAHGRGTCRGACHVSPQAQRWWWLVGPAYKLRTRPRSGEAGKARAQHGDLGESHATDCLVAADARTHCLVSADAPLGPPRMPAKGPHHFL